MAVSVRMRQVLSLPLQWFHGDDKQNERLVRASQSIYSILHRYLALSNEAFNMLNRHLNTSFEKIIANETEGIKDFFERIKTAVQYIDDTAVDIDKHIRKNMDPSLYEKINVNVGLKEKAMIAKMFNEATMGIFGDVCGSFVAVIFSKARLSETAVPLIENSPIWSLSIENLLLPSNKIAELLSGPDPEKDINDVILKLEADVEVLTASCNRYDYSVTGVQAYIDLIMENF